MHMCGRGTIDRGTIEKRRTGSCESLHALGETYERCEPLRRACRFLLSKQRADGGWGESYLSCQDRVYSQLPEGEASHVVNTAWAMLALMYAGQFAVDSAPLRRAAGGVNRSERYDSVTKMKNLNPQFFIPH